MSDDGATVEVLLYRDAYLAGIDSGDTVLLYGIAAARASTVFTHLDEGVDWRSRWRSSIQVGRDHAASAIYTIIFSVLGAGLAGFIMSATLDVPLGVLLQSDTGATTVVQALAGIVGTVVAMPVTTWCAIFLARRLGTQHSSPGMDPSRAAV